MSEFDKEAERRRLREKYEAEQEDRATTERMSQLLLQGATMTNQHCDACGNPIFRYQGQEFCPTCQAEAGAGGADAGGDAVADTPAQDEPGTAAQGADSRTRTPSAQGAEAEPQVTEQAPALREDTTPVLPEADADLEDAIDALTATITTLAARAEQTDDPRRAKEFLEAAHEAAETLASLTH